MRRTESLFRGMAFSIINILSTALLISGLLAQTEKANWVPGRIIVKFKYGKVELPEGKVESDFASVDIRSEGLKEALGKLKIRRFSKVVPNAARGDTLRTLPDGRQIRLTDFSQLYLLTFSEEISVDSVIAMLQKREEVMYAEPEQYNVYDIEPNDEFYNDQWHLKQGNDEDIDAVEAWELSKGDGIKIAIHDTGVRTTHEDLINKREGGESSFSSTHGTMVAGVAAATTNNTVGVAGVAWNSKFIPYNNGGTVSGDVADINAAVSAGADIINMSWSLPFYSQSLKDALDNAFAQGILLVTSAGNDELATPPYIAYPQDFDGLVTAVTATNKDGSFRNSSNYGNFVDVAAPGQFIKTTDGDYDQDYASPSGTSFSSPIVAGIAALLLAVNPQLEDRDIERIIELSAEKTNSEKFPYDSNCWNNHMGYGRVNARQALDLVNSNQFFHWSTSGGTVTEIIDNFPVWFYDLPGGAPNGKYICKRYEVQKSVTFPQTFTTTPVVWGRINGTVGYKGNNANNNYSIPWCDVVNVSPFGATLRTFVYEGSREDGSYYGWYPTTPDNVIFAYTVMGVPGTPQAPPAAPTNLTITNAGNIGQNPNLSWDPSSGATSYKIYRTVTPVNWQVIGTTTSTSYTDWDVIIENQSNADDEFYYEVTAANDYGESDPSNIVSTWGTTFQKQNVREKNTEQFYILPEDYALHQNYPNPFNPTTTIRYELPEYSHVVITIYNLRGQIVTKLVDKRQDAVYHFIKWNAFDQPCGIYICKMETPKFVAIQKMTILK